MAGTPSGWLRVLERGRMEFGPAAAATRRATLDALAGAEFARPAALVRFHDALCFLRAHPDDAGVLRAIERLLAGFATRRDLRRHARALANRGIAGTEIHFAFYADTARWLARRFPGRLHVRWREFERRDRLDALLPLLTLFPESPGLDEYAFRPREWIARLKGPDETDADFLIRRFAALRLDSQQHEILYDGLDVPLTLAPGPGGPSRTAALLPGRPVVFQRRPLDRTRPDVRRAARARPRAVRVLTLAEARRAIALARDCMIVRSRDLDAFIHADPRDVRIVTWENGLEFVVMGVKPERRLLLESVYAFLTLRNGVPIGYVLVSGLFGSSEVAYNVFDTWRGAEAAWVYGRVLATTRWLFASATFTIMPYQLGGQGNDEGLRSGAWWFYRKLGFAPRDPEAVRLARREAARIRRSAAHRTGVATLAALAAHNLFFDLGRRRRDVIGALELGNVGLRVSRFLAAGWGADRERAARDCTRQARRLLGAGRLAGWSRAERAAFARWSPLVVALHGVARWSRTARRALLDVIRAKGGRREADFARRFDRHAPLRRAIRALAETDPP